MCASEVNNDEEEEGDPVTGTTLQQAPVVVPFFTFFLSLLFLPFLSRSGKCVRVEDCHSC